MIFRFLLISNKFTEQEKAYLSSEELKNNIACLKEDLTKFTQVRIVYCLITNKVISANNLKDIKEQLDGIDFILCYNNETYTKNPLIDIFGDLLYKVIKSPWIEENLFLQHGKV